MSELGARVALAALAIAASLFDARENVSPVEPQVREPVQQSAPDGSEGANVILVVSDGLRWQEVFRGADSAQVAATIAATVGFDLQAANRHATPPISVSSRNAPVH